MKSFSQFINETSTGPQRPLKKISDLSINRRYKGERYEYELFPKLRRLQKRFANLDRKPNLEEFFNTLQLEDSEFYTLVQTDVLGQPDIRELWRDLTGQRSSRMKRFNLAESLEEPVSWQSRLDPNWTVVASWPSDSLYGSIAKIFDSFGIAFADLDERMIYIDGVQVEQDNLSQDHLLAIEAHEISHYLLGHRRPQAVNYDEAQEREADWFAIMLLQKEGFNRAADLLEQRYQDYYGESSSDLTNDSLILKLRNHLIA